MAARPSAGVLSACLVAGWPRLGAVTCACQALGRENASEAGYVHAGLGRQSSQSRNEIQRLEHLGGGAIAIWGLQAVANVTLWHQ